jgi:hypothetical protein
MRKLVRVLEATLKGPQAAPSARLTHDLTRAKEQTASAGSHPDFQPGTGSAAGGSGTNSAFGGVGVEAEQVVEALLGGVGFGEHPPGSGPSAVALVEQHGLLDAAEVVEERAHA